MKISPAQKITEKKVEDPEAKDVFIRMLIGPDDGADKFHMRLFRVLPGGHTPRHLHDWEHENYIISGQGRVMTPDGPRPVGPGDVVFIEAGIKHQYQNAGDEDFVFLCLIPAVNPG